MTTILTLTLTDPMRTCSVSTEIIKAATDINGILEAEHLDEPKLIDMSNIADEVKRLKKIVVDINEARVSNFREIEEIRIQFKSQIDEKILNPISSKISEYEAKIKSHNDEVRRLEIAAAVQSPTTNQVSAPIMAAIPVRQKPYKCRCVDLSKVPSDLKYEVFNQVRADLMVKTGTRHITGCLIDRI